MVSMRLATVLALGHLCLGQTTVPTCGLLGWDSTGTNIGYYPDSATSFYSNFTICESLCTANTECQSFAYDTSVACILYNVTAEANVIADSTSPWTFFDAGGVCPTVATTTTTSTTSTTVPVSTATPTCVGFEGYDIGGNIGYYVDAASVTFGGCEAICDANAACLSFALTSNPVACIIYNYTVEGNDISSPGSGNTFYDKGGACPSTTAVTTTTSSPTSSVTTPVQTGAFPNCPSNLVPYNVLTLATPYSPCNASFPASACMSDIDGISTYCNLCNACTSQTCTSDSDCGTGYACIENSDCPINGVASGAAVCLYMLDGGAEYGCYTSA